MTPVNYKLDNIIIVLYNYRLDTVFDVSMCNRTTMETV